MEKVDFLKIYLEGPAEQIQKIAKKQILTNNKINL